MNKETEQIILQVRKIVNSISEYEGYEDNKVLQKYVLLYESYANALIEDDGEDIKRSYEKVSTLSRAFLETSSDWKAPFLYEMSELTKIVDFLGID